MAEFKPELQVEMNENKETSADCMKRIKAYAEILNQMIGGKKNE